MSLQISGNVQHLVPDSIAYSGDINLGVRANGEEVTSILDEAGNLYPAGIPVPSRAATLVSISAQANTLLDGYYGYTYVYAATKRYPLVDAGVGIGGSIAPRGNPATSIVVQVTGGPAKVLISVACNTRQDISEIWIFRTIKFNLQSDAQIAIDAGLAFYMGKVTNNTGISDNTYLDTNPNLGSSVQVEKDNFFAPTFRYVRYIPPYFWGAGNEPFIAQVTWDNYTVTLVNPTDSWFSGRNGQLATIQGITVGGIDGRGTFYFKVGDFYGFNTRANAVLTTDGVTPALLSPTSGSGYIKIVGPGSTLYRSKARNPLAWGLTNVFGVSRISSVFAQNVGSGRITAIIAIPGDELIKVDLKNPSVCYSFNLRAAAYPEFGSTRRIISSVSVSSHASQFYATTQSKNKVVWGWDSDTFAILQSDGVTQQEISDPVFKTLRNATKDPDRIVFSHGLCDEKNQLNCIWIPFQGSANFSSPNSNPNFVTPIPSITDLLLFQHFPSGRWGTVNEFDLTSAAVVRNLAKNRIEILGGTDKGILGSINGTNELGVVYNWLSFDTEVVSSTSGPPSTITVTLGTFSSLSNYDELRSTLVGTWASIYRSVGTLQPFYGRISALDSDTLTFDIFFNAVNGDSIVNQISGVLDTQFFLSVGAIPKIFKRSLDFQAPTTNKVIKKLFYQGYNLIYSKTILSLEGVDVRDPEFDEIQSLNPNYNTVFEVRSVAIPEAKKIDLTNMIHFAAPAVILKGIGVKV